MVKKRHISPEEEYLKIILSLCEGGGQAKTNDVARALGIAPASATQMLEKLAEKGLLRHSPYKGVQLTKKGRETAEMVLRRYQLLERFFIEYLKIAPKEAAAQACLMEHCISKETEKSICQIMKHPEFSMDKKHMPKCRLGKDCDSCMKSAPVFGKGAKQFPF